MASARGERRKQSCRISQTGRPQACEALNMRSQVSPEAYSTQKDLQPCMPWDESRLHISLDLHGAHLLSISRRASRTRVNELRIAQSARRLTLIHVATGFLLQL
jgi:hypothetical protein